MNSTEQNPTRIQYWLHGDIPAVPILGAKSHPFSTIIELDSDIDPLAYGKRWCESQGVQFAYITSRATGIRAS